MIIPELAYDKLRLILIIFGGIKRLNPNQPINVSLYKVDARLLELLKFREARSTNQETFCGGILDKILKKYCLNRQGNSSKPC